MIDQGETVLRIWLRAGVLAAGLGAAVAAGQGSATASADGGTGSAAASSGASAGSAASPAGTASAAPSGARSRPNLGPRRAFQGRVDARSGPAIRPGAKTQRDIPEAESGIDAPRTVTLAVPEGDIPTPPDNAVTSTGGLVVKTSPDRPYDRRRPGADTRPARADRDSSRPESVDAVQDLAPFPDRQDAEATVASAATVTTAVAKPPTIRSFVSHVMARIGFKPLRVSLALPRAVRNWWADVRARLLGLPKPGSGAAPGDPPLDPGAGSSEPVLLWETNFTSVSEAMQAWSLQRGRWGQVAGENQYYTADFSNVTVDADGHLIITVRRERTPDNAAAPNNYTSARMVTHGKQTVEPNSRIVARMQLPYSKGLLPAFWMVGLEPGHEFDWPRQGEVDIIEYPGFGTAEGASHWTGNVHGPAATNNTVDVKLHNIGGDTGTDLSQGFHEYGIDWYTDRIVWHIDGVQTGQVTRAQYEALGGDWTPFSGAWPHYLILNVAVGHDWTGDPDPSAQFPPQQMKVDWVRVYSLSAD
ncbi:family 16 glycosylhydrolase [Mycobacterium sp. AMU20-3851]|uniref:glycoside hydrolase family 16 protein n=1 Tax=Mycobacterium sp. AMU20-3851 TaxID=3122055 RepID=UPI0037547DDF